MKIKDIQDRYESILDSTHTLEDCNRSIGLLREILHAVTDVHAIDYLESCVASIGHIKEGILVCGEAKFNYIVLEEKLKIEWTTHKRIQLLQKTEKIFNKKFHHSLYGKLILDMIREERTKLN